VPAFYGFLPSSSPYQILDESFPDLFSQVQFALLLVVNFLLLLSQYHLWSIQVLLFCIPAISQNDVEKLIGHKNGLKGLYYDPQDLSLFQEYKKAIPELTIGDIERVKEIKP